MWKALRSAGIWAGIAVAVFTCWFVGTVLGVISLTWDYRKRRFACHFSRIWAIWVARVNPAWRTYVDDERLPKKRHFVIVSNHQSLGDIIISLHLNHHFKFISKDSVFRVPCLGWFMYIAGYMKLERGKKHSIISVMEQSRAWLDKGVSVLFYPEGTRSPAGEIRPFKLGAFKLAIEAGVDVLPVLLTGAADLLPKNSFYFSDKATPMRLVVGDPISVAGMSADSESVEKLATHAREVLVEMWRKQDEEIAREELRKAR